MKTSISKPENENHDPQPDHPDTKTPNPITKTTPQPENLIRKSETLRRNTKTFHPHTSNPRDVCKLFTSSWTKSEFHTTVRHADLRENARRARKRF